MYKQSLHNLSERLLPAPKGSAELTEKQIVLVRGGQRTKVELIDEQWDTLDDFLESLQEGFEPETSAADYMRTQALVHCAKLSSSKEQMVNVLLPDFGDSAAAWRGEGRR